MKQTIFMIDRKLLECTDYSKSQIYSAWDSAVDKQDGDLQGVEQLQQVFGRMQQKALRIPKRLK